MLQQLFSEWAKHYVALHCGCVIGLICSGHCMIVAEEKGESILCVRGGYTAVHKVLADNEVIGRTTFSALRVGQIQIRIFIAWRYASVVYAIIMCPSVWCGCSIPAAEWLDLPAVGIATLAHAVGESIFRHEGRWRGSSQTKLGEDLLLLAMSLCN